MQQTSTKRKQEQAWLDGEHDPLGIVQEIEISYELIVHTQTIRICLRKLNAYDSLRIRDTNRLPNPGQKTRTRFYKQKRKESFILWI